MKQLPCIKQYVPLIYRCSWILYQTAVITMKIKHLKNKFVLDLVQALKVVI